MAVAAILDFMKMFYLIKFNVVFNASKSKCIRCLPIGISKPVTPTACFPSFSIGSNAIEFVAKWPHLGHVITSDGDDTDDILEAKLRLIGQINKVLYNFREVNCETKTILVPVSMDKNYGIYLKITSSQFVLLGGKILDTFGSFQTPHTQHSYQTYATHYHCWMFLDLYVC